jgi:pimeloyl-ACP methyl ester carboxylesterase
MKHILTTLTLTVTLAMSGAAYAEKPEALETGVDSAFYMSDAAYYPADGEKAVVFVPGFIFNKESWKKMATKLQSQGIASVAISTKSENPIRRAIQELTRRGHSNVVLVGGSSGAAAILNTMEQVTATDVVTGVVLMSPVRGNPMDDQPIGKLFIVSEGEKSFEKVQALHDGSSEPKTIMTFPGKAHAQFLLFGPDKADVEAEIVKFIIES